MALSQSSLRCLARSYGDKPTGNRNCVVRSSAPSKNKTCLRSVVASPKRSAKLTVRPVAVAQAEQPGSASPPVGKIISKNEVPAFIPRDDMMDQLYRWTLMEAVEGGVRNFGMPMKVEPCYEGEQLWGFIVGIYKEGSKQCDLKISFDTEIIQKHEWVGRGEDGFPILEGKVDSVKGKHFQIWKIDDNPVSEDLRTTIRRYCTALVTALNRYYAFGSVFVEEST